MTIDEAKKIIDDFHNSITDLRPDSIVQSIEDLPCTSGRIKYAHFVYGEYLTQNFESKGKTFEESIAYLDKAFNVLKESYGIIDSFFVENSEQVNIKYREYLENLKRGMITEFSIPNPFGEIMPVMEFHNFLGESFFIKHKENIFNKNLLNTSAYHFLNKQLKEEKDIKKLIDLANTAKTRTVDFPGRKSNEESIK
ncbi:MAG: hypothetical protein WD963_02355 [Candidatus Paceibacterota bacterium]